MALNVVNKAIEFAFAMLYVRLLGPEGTGQYAFALPSMASLYPRSRYGLAVSYSPGDVATKINQAATRPMSWRCGTLLWPISLPLLGIVIWLYRSVDTLHFFGWYGGELTPIGTAEVQALLIFAASMLFANWADVR